MLESYLIFVIFFTRAKFLENKIYTEKTRKLRQNTQKIANFLRYYGKIHSKLPILRVKSVKIYTGQKKFTRPPPVAPLTNMRYGTTNVVLLSFYLQFTYICSRLANQLCRFAEECTVFASVFLPGRSCLEPSTRYKSA